MSWKSLVKTLAPTLGTALGGPLGGAATKFIADKLLGNPDATESDVSDFILGASPDQLATLKQIDADFKMKMKELDVDVFKLEVADRSDARALAKVNMWPQIVLSGLFIVGYFILLRYLLKGSIEVSPQMLPVATTIIGVMTAAVTSIMQFWFGSSSGSKTKIPPPQSSSS